MEYTKYSEVKNKIMNCRPFEGNSCSAISVGNEYIVYSYNTPILVVKNGVKQEFNNTYFSNTTSKMQNIICRFYNLPTKRDQKKDGEKK